MLLYKFRHSANITVISYVKIAEISYAKIAREIQASFP